MINKPFICLFNNYQTLNNYGLYPSKYLQSSGKNMKTSIVLALLSAKEDTS